VSRRDGRPRPGWGGRAALVVAASALSALVLGACGGPDITQARVDDAVGPTFAHLYARQQSLLGRATGGTPQASANCHRSGSAKNEPSTGAGEDWVCTLLLQIGGPSGVYTYEVNVQADGCYVADGPLGLIGAKTLTTPTGATRVNPLFAFDGCFDT
jgi:hypothetical protein